MLLSILAVLYMEINIYIAVSIFPKKLLLYLKVSFEDIYSIT